MTRAFRKAAADARRRFSLEAGSQRARQRKLRHFRRMHARLLVHVGIPALSALRCHACVMVRWYMAIVQGVSLALTLRAY